MRPLRRLIAVLAAMLIVAALSAPVATAALLVVAEDDAYTAIHDQLLSVSAAAGVLANDTGVGLTAERITNPAHGTLTFSSDGSFTYRPAAGYTGSDSFIYEARVLSLGILVTDQAVVKLTVTNAAPVANDDSYTATTGVTLTVPAPGVLADDSDADGDSLRAILVDGGGNGSLDLNSDGSFTYKSGGSFTGTRTFTYRASDGIASSNTATVTITVSPGATPTPTPAPTPTPTPTPSPTPTLASPTPTPSPTATPAVTPTPDPAATASPTASPTATREPTAAPGLGATRSPGPGTSGSPTPAAGAEATDAPGSGSTGSDGGTRAPGDRFVVPAAEPPGIDATIDASFAGFGGIEWAVPAFALGVPGLLLMIAVGAQTIVGVAWLPFVRRWLGGVGVRRRVRT